MEVIRQINVGKHSKSRPNSLAYKLSLSADMIKALGISENDRTVKVEIVDGKLIIEKVDTE